MKEKVLNVLIDKGCALTVQEIMKEIEVDDKQTIIKILEELVNELEIWKTKKNRYILFEKTELLKGELRLNRRGFGFVHVDNNDIFVGAKELKDAVDGDVVAIQLNKDNKAEIVGIEKRDDLTIIGEVKCKNGKYTIIPNRKYKKFEVVIDSRKPNGAVDGSKVRIKLDEKIGDLKYKGSIIEVICHKDDPDKELKSIAAEFDISTNYSDEVLKETALLPDYVSDEEIQTRINNGGKDLRNHLIFTIDGDDTKDIDDALEFRDLPNGNIEISAHIADVEHYVNYGSALYEHSMNKGTSHYWGNRRVALLPPKLSNGICSLNPNVDRMALSFVLETNYKGDIINFDINESIINSKKQMTYKNVNKILEENIIPKDYEQFVYALKMLDKMAHVFREKRFSKGALSFDFPEPKFVFDENNDVIDIELRTRGAGERLIEDYMLLFGQLYAERQENAIFRNESQPFEHKINHFMDILNGLGYHYKLTDNSGKSIQKLLDSLKDKKEYLVLARNLLMSIPRASYSSQNYGHFALASKCNAQIGSPIRRCGDLKNHTLIKQNIYAKYQNIDLVSSLEDVAKNASKTEEKADECEKAMEDLFRAKYMMHHKTEEFTGMITNVLKNGLVVELPNTVRGFVDTYKLEDNYTFVPDKFMLRNNRTGKCYKLGDTIKVNTADIDLENRTIEFEIINEKIKKYR